MTFTRSLDAMATRHAIPRILAMLTLVSALTAPGASAGGFGLSSIGPRIGLRFDPDQLVLGGHASFYDPGSFRLVAVTELGVGDDVTLLSISPEIHYVARSSPLATGLFFFVGGGLDIANLWFDVGNNSVSDTDIGVTVLGGLEGQLPAGLIFQTELRVSLHDWNDWFELDGGLVFPLGD